MSDAPSNQAAGEQQTPPGYYDDGHGDQRWWDGTKWTERVQKAGEKAAKVSARHPQADLPDTIWSSVGRPITGIGAGRYRLTEHTLFFEKGALSLKAQQIATHEIHDVDAAQTLTQKARGVGNITLHAIRAGGREIVVIEDIPNFREGVQKINEVAQAARNALRVAQQTQHVNYSGTPGQPMPPQPAGSQAPAAASPAGGSDLMAELSKLAAFKEQGILDAEEFAAAKRKLLGL